MIICATVARKVFVPFCYHPITTYTMVKYSKNYRFKMYDVYLMSYSSPQMFQLAHEHGIFKLQIRVRHYSDCEGWKGC